VLRSAAITWGMAPAAHLRALLVKGHVADPVGAVLDAPMVAQEMEDRTCLRPLGGETGHAVDLFVALLARLLEGDVAPDCGAWDTVGSDGQ